MIDITAIVLTHNSQNSIANTLASLRFIKNILVVDDHSTDKTVTLAKKSGATVISHSLNSDWATQRNYALTKVHTDWAFFVDSDEVVTKQLQQEITHLKPGNISGYYIKRLDVFCGRELHHGETGSISLLRLAKCRAGRWSRPVHETWSIAETTKTLTHPLLHVRNLDISSLVIRFDSYANLDAQQFSRSPFHYLSLLKPYAKFVYNYIYLLGFLDGYAGLTFAYLMSFYSLTVRIKTWETVSSKPAS